MDWIPFLNSKVRGDEFTALSGDKAAENKWLHLNRILKDHIFRASDQLPHDATTSYYLAENGGEYVICALGDVAHYLGRQHPQSVDRRTPDSPGRRKPFILGYKASEGASIPSLQDLEGMHDIIKCDLERMFEDAERTYPHYQGGASFRTHLPASGMYGENAWDQAAQRIARGESINGMVVLQGGGLQSIAFAPPVTQGHAEPHASSTAGATPHVFGQKRNFSEWAFKRGKENSVGKITAWVAGASGAALALYALAHRDKDRDGSWQGRHDARQAAAHDVAQGR